MNRKERREREKELRKDKSAFMCPLCKKKSLFVSIPIKDSGGKCDIVCELCNGSVKKEVDAIPFVYCDIKQREGERE